MSETNSTLLELAPAYALGALDADESRRFEEFLATSEEARREVAAYREVAALLALSHAGEPSPTLRARVLESAPPADARPVTITRPRAQRPALRFLPWLAAAASLALAATSWRAAEVLRGQLAGRDSLARMREAVIQRQESTLGSLLGAGIEVYELSATGATAPGMRVFVDRARQRALVSAYRLRPAPSGRTYQLWFIRDGVPVPSVTFSPGADGRAVVADVVIPADGTVSAAALTEEPAGGSLAPTTTPFLAGAIGRT